MEKSRIVEDSQQNELMQFLGIRIDQAGGDEVVLSMEVTPRVHQYVGIMNGGISLLLCETAASLGAVLASDLERCTPVGIEINANHLRAVSKGVIKATAKPVYHGRTTSIWNTEITNERGKLICVSRCTILLRRSPASPPPAQPDA